MEEKLVTSSVQKEQRIGSKIEKQLDGGTLTEDTELKKTNTRFPEKQLSWIEFDTQKFSELDVQVVKQLLASEFTKKEILDAFPEYHSMKIEEIMNSKEESSNFAERNRIITLRMMKFGTSMDMVTVKLFKTATAEDVQLAIKKMKELRPYPSDFLSRTDVHPNQIVKDTSNLEDSKELKQHDQVSLAGNVSSQATTLVQFLILVEDVVATYKIRLDTLDKAFLSIENKYTSFPCNLDSFGLFLKSENRPEDGVKWYVFDTCLQDSNLYPKLKLRDVKNYPALLKVFQNSVASIGKGYSIKRLVLHKEEKHKLDKAMSKYMAKIPGLVISLFILQKSLCDQWTDVIYGFKLLIERKYPDGSFFTKLIKNITRVVCLYLASKVGFYFSKQEFEKAQSAWNGLFGLAKGVLEEDEIHSKQVNDIILHTLAVYQKKFNPVHVLPFREFCYKLITTRHSSEELNNYVGDYKSNELDERLSKITNIAFEPHKWQEIIQNTPSESIKLTFEEFGSKFKTWIRFHNQIDLTGPLFRQGHRRIWNYIFTEEHLS